MYLLDLAPYEPIHHAGGVWSHNSVMTAAAVAIGAIVVLIAALIIINNIRKK